MQSLGKRMPLSNLKRSALLDQSAQENSKEMQELISRLRNKPFYIWGKAEHKDAMNASGRLDHPHAKMQCCFNHIIGLPRKGDSGKEYPLFDYAITFEMDNRITRRRGRYCNGCY